jgi:hypothetical protein
MFAGPLAARSVLDTSGRAEGAGGRSSASRVAPAAERAASKIPAWSVGSGALVGTACACEWRTRIATTA